MPRCVVVSGCVVLVGVHAVIRINTTATQRTGMLIEKSVGDE
jgi:hypothetical protein